MKLNLRDRLLLIQILPQVGKLSEIKVSKKLSAVLLPTQEEQTKFEIVQTDSAITWGNMDTDVDLNIENDLDFIKQLLIKMDEESKIDAEYAEIIDKLFNGNL